MKYANFENQSIQIEYRCSKWKSELLVILNVVTQKDSVSRKFSGIRFRYIFCSNGVKWRKVAVFQNSSLLIHVY